MSCTTSCNKKPAQSAAACFDRMSYGLPSSQSSWETNCVLMYKLQNEHKLQSSYEQRQWLQNNAERLINEARATANVPACAPCSENGPLVDALPESSIQQCNSVACTYASPKFGEGISGLGQGRNFSYLDK